MHTETETNRLYYGLPVGTPCPDGYCNAVRVRGVDGRIQYGPYVRGLCEDHYRGHLHCLPVERERAVAQALRAAKATHGVRAAKVRP